MATKKAGRPPKGAVAKTAAPIVLPYTAAGGNRAISEMTPDDLPSDEVLLELGIEPNETAKFWKALQLVTLQISGKTIYEACEMIGMGRNTPYDPIMQRLLAAARRLLMGKAMMDVSVVAAQVYKEWPRLIEQLVYNAYNADRTSASNEAIELLHIMFMKDAEMPSDASEARKYLREVRNFNPNAPINLLNVQDGAQVVINNGGPDIPEPPVNSEIVVEAEVIRPADDAPANPLAPLQMLAGEGSGSV